MGVRAANRNQKRKEEKRKGVKQKQKRDLCFWHTIQIQISLPSVLFIFGERCTKAECRNDHSVSFNAERRQNGGCLTVFAVITNNSLYFYSITGLSCNFSFKSRDVALRIVTIMFECRMSALCL
jgi:hypothetical protein